MIRRFPSQIELRAQYGRSGQRVRDFEEFYDYQATIPCLAYGAFSTSEVREIDMFTPSPAGTPPGPVGSEAFGGPPPYT